MIQEIKSSFREMLRENEWIDLITKRQALRKVTFITPLVGHPDFYLDDNLLNRHFKKVPYTSLWIIFS